MALKIFNNESEPQGKVQNKPSIHFSFNRGIVSISVGAVEQLGLKEFEYVSIAQDEKNEDQWYIYKSDSTGYRVKKHAGAKKGESLFFQHRSLAKKIADSVAFEGSSGRCQVSKTPYKVEGIKNPLYAIITATLKNK